ncbi:hypothetical protein Kpho01_48110 [Kitasatospora phosalacinea]|uniref:Type I-E CRISPR-associated protein Cas5/CasD n=1 Tax=Kitasatospora phosalacinea TaxID=2065 RepID=A0A9W6PKR3_9ACTN|nr:hypothetical protein Kpho01_48110 [Kitasatospora phosalacinea]
MSGLLLRLAGPLQSWGHHSAFHHRDTAAHPTRSALIGMFASAQGRPRDHALDPYPDLPGNPSHHDLTFTVRIDKPGTPHTDYHTVGGARYRGRGREGLLPTSDGGHRTEAASTLQSWRHYLADAVFTVAVHGPAPLIARIADALAEPHWAPFLGRRTCIPDEPLVLTPTPVTDPVTELLTRAPLTLTHPPEPGHDSVDVDIVWEHPPPTRPDHRYSELPAEPVDFTSHHRLHLPRPLWRTTESLPAHLYAGHRPLDALTRYVLKDTPCPSSP